MSNVTAGRTQRVSVPMLIAGGVMVAAFFGLDNTSNTLRVQFVQPWDRSVVGELYFWLAACVYLLPGSALLGASVSSLLSPGLERLRTRLGAADTREQLAIVACLAVISWSLAHIGNQVVLHGLAFTDDEDAARFGGQVLASGTLWAPLPPLRFAFPDLFLFQRAGYWTSFDFPGALLPWLISELTHSETLVFSIFACIAPAAVARASMRYHGTVDGGIAGLLLLCSPMALTLSMTSHTHVVSRGLLALGLGFVLFVDRPSVSRSVAAGLAFGVAFATRPMETTMLLSPLMLNWIHEAWRDRALRSRIVGLALGAAPGIIGLLAYNHALTGSWGFPRSSPNEISVPYGDMMRGPFDLSQLWPRFGNNFAYNTLTLSIWFLGPAGLTLSWLGARASRLHALLGVGVLLDLALTLLHDDRGLHMVGPIHLSEAVIPLAILAAAGLSRARTGLERLGIARMQTATAFLGYAACGLVIFSIWHGRALQVQALARATLTTLAEHVPKRPAVVLACSYGTLREKFPLFEATGGFAFSWRRARPDLSEPVLILLDSPRARAEVTRAFPDRTAYVLDPDHYGPAPVRLDSLLPSVARSRAAIVPTGVAPTVVAPKPL